MEIDVIDWKLIGSCNLRCLHCYGPDKVEKALPIDDLFQIAEKFRKLKAKWVVLTGGEPMLVPGIDLLIRELAHQGLKVALSTNSMFFRGHEKTIETYVSSLNIPLDGSTPERHARSRLDTRSFHTFFDVLEHYMENLREKPKLLRVGTVYSAANEGDFQDMAKLLEIYDSVIDTWKIYELMDYEFQPERREPLLNHGSFVREMTQLLGSTKLASKIHVSPANSRDQAYFMVNPRGDVVMPTEQGGRTYEISVANILTDSLEKVVEAWQSYVQPSNYFRNHDHYTMQRQNKEPVHRLPLLH